MFCTDVLFPSLRQLSPLHKAARGGDLDKVKELVEKPGADINIRSADSRVRIWAIPLVLYTLVLLI